MYPLKRNPAEVQLGEAAFDETRVARLLRAPDGSVRVALVGPAGEFASVPLTDRTREGLARAVQVVAELRARLALSAAPAPPPSAPQPAPSAPAALNFADKVETLRRHIEEAQGANLRASARERGIEVPKSALGYIALRTEPSRQYWYLIAQGSRRWAVDTTDGSIYPMNSAGLMGKKHGMPGIPIDDMGLYDWTSRYYWPPKAAAPSPVAWVRSDLTPPAAPKPKKAPEDRAVTLRPAPNFDTTPWAPARLESSGGKSIRGVTGMMQSGYEGGRYAETERMTRAQIASLIREDIKQAIASGTLPPMEVSVTTENYSGGGSINLRVKRLLAGVKVLNPAWAEALVRAGGDTLKIPRNIERLTEVGGTILKQLEAIHRRYNRDNSDTQSDYFDVRYYGDANYDQLLLEQQENDALAVRGLAERRDLYLEHQLVALLQEGPLKVPRRFDVRVFPQSDGYKLRFLEVRRMLTEMDGVSLDDAPEVLYAWAREFAMKKNRRPAPRQRSRR